VKPEANPNPKSKTGAINMSDDDKAWQNWRQILKVHPVADEFPKATDKALKELRGSIGSDGSGLEMPIVLASIAGGETVLIDGRTRLDALEANGVRVFNTFGHLAVKHTIEQLADEADAWELGKKLNHDRRHLKHENKVAIAKSILIKCPTRSNRSIARELGCSHNTVEKLRQATVATTVDQTSSGGQVDHLIAPTPAVEQSACETIPTAPAAEASPEPAPITKPEKRTGADGKVYPIKPKKKAQPTKETKPAETPTPPPISLQARPADASHPSIRNPICQAWHSGEEEEREEFAREFGLDVARYLEAITAPPAVPNDASVSAQIN
jgi:hypothetical protein